VSTRVLDVERQRIRANEHLHMVTGQCPVFQCERHGFLFITSLDDADEAIVVIGSFADPSPHGSISRAPKRLVDAGMIVQEAL